MPHFYLSVSRIYFIFIINMEGRQELVCSSDLWGTFKEGQRAHSVVRSALGCCHVEACSTTG